MKLSKKERENLRARKHTKRPYGEIVDAAKRHGIAYHTLWRWCQEEPHLPAEEIIRRRGGPMDPKEAGRKGGLATQGKA